MTERKEGVAMRERTLRMIAWMSTAAGLVFAGVPVAPHSLRR